MWRVFWSLLILGHSMAAFAVNEVEVTAPVQVSPANAFAFYNPTGILITNNGKNYLYLYLQGGGSSADEKSCPSGDHIIAFRAALDAHGNPGAFTRVGRVSPCAIYPLASDPMNAPTASYEPGQIFKATINGVTAYHMLADVSDTSNFRIVWHGWTVNGYDWTWEVTGQPGVTGTYTEPPIHDASDLLTHSITWQAVSHPFLWVNNSTSNIFLLNPIMLSTNFQINNSQWWGFFNYISLSSGFTFSVGEMLVDWSTGSPQIQILTGISPSYTFSSYLVNGEIPNNLQYPLVSYGIVKSLLFDSASGVYQLWGELNGGPSHGGFAYNTSTVSCNTNTMVTCPSGSAFCTVNGVPSQPGCPTGDGSCVAPGATVNAFAYNTGTAGPALTGTGSGFAWWPVTRFSFGSTNLVYSTVRSMPSGYEVARLYPFRWNSGSGTRYLFSATNDAHICTELLFSSFFKMYVTMSTVARQ